MGKQRASVTGSTKGSPIVIYKNLDIKDNFIQKVEELFKGPITFGSVPIDSAKSTFILNVEITNDKVSH